MQGVWKIKQWGEYLEQKSERRRVIEQLPPEKNFSIYASRQMFLWWFMNGGRDDRDMHFAFERVKIDEV
jgi:hypothetical protein